MQQERVLHRALRAGEEAITHGIHSVADVEKLMHRVIEEEGGVDVDYLAVVDPSTFEAPIDFRRDVLLAGAVRMSRHGGGREEVDGRRRRPQYLARQGADQEASARCSPNTSSALISISITPDSLSQR